MGASTNSAKFTSLGYDRFHSGWRKSGEPFPMIEQLNDKKFQFWEYLVSHGSLLIRSPKKGDQQYNVDIKFYGVEYVAVPRHLEGIVQSKVNAEEVKHVERMLGKPVNKDNVFVLESSTGRHLVVAAKMKVEENEADIFNSPFN